MRWKLAILVFLVTGSVTAVLARGHAPIAGTIGAFGQKFVGANGSGGSIAPTCNGTLDLSTGCAQLVAYGGLF